MKRIAIAAFLILGIVIFGRLSNIYTEYDYTFYSKDIVNPNMHLLHIGFDGGNIPLNIGGGFLYDNNFYPQITVGSMMVLKSVYLEPYFRYIFNKGVYTGINLRYKNLLFFSDIYKEDKINVSFGFGLKFSLIKFGNENFTYIDTPDNISVIAGRKISFYVKAYNKTVPAEGIHVFYSINNNEKVYSGKTDENGMLKIWIPPVFKSGEYTINIFVEDKEVRMKEIILRVFPDRVYSLKIEFDKDIIYTEIPEILHIKSLKMYDKYGNLIEMPELDFLSFKVLGDYREIKYSYLDNTVFLNEFKNSGEYTIVYSAEIEGKEIAGSSKIKVIDNPKNISNTSVEIEFLGYNNDYAEFLLKNPRIYFWNSESVQPESVSVFYNGKKVYIKNNRFRVFLKDNLKKKVQFDVEFFYCNFYNTISIDVDLEKN
ncbi:hypothetical protein XO10_03840 [Marinitoga sp. 1135]|uniref:hypothetical protein n=1 Tax=unclassified Marinitoga TaxID=2640159 RepID=UPI001585EAE7|nr:MULTISPECIES: hypothetical protein [unclassified Marinitoga]NUU95429.1 hypothetical protein [Marinitoga sp. 1135]NUU97356.1 hypothetical protein [Marinitoga sp. 1138]